MRQSFDVPFNRLGTADLRVPLSANPRYRYDKDRRCVHVTHDPLPQFAHDQMPHTFAGKRALHGRLGTARDQGSGNEIMHWLREHLRPDDFAELCRMCGIEVEEEKFDEEHHDRRSRLDDFEDDLESDRNKLPYDGAHDERQFNERYPHAHRIKNLG